MSYWDGRIRDGDDRSRAGRGPGTVGRPCWSADHRGGRIPELAFSTPLRHGILACLLAAEGYRVRGQDVLGGMLEVAAERAAAGEAIEWVLGPGRASAGRIVDAVVLRT